MKFRENKKPQGHYRAKIVYMGDTPSRHGIPMATFGFKVIGDDRSVYPWYCPISDDSIHKLTAVFHSLDLPTPQKAKVLDGTIPLPVDAFIGQEVLILLESNLWKGNWRSSVKRVLHVREGNPVGLVYDVPDPDGDLKL